MFSRLRQSILKGNSGYSRILSGRVYPQFSASRVLGLNNILKDNENFKSIHKFLTRTPQRNYSVNNDENDNKNKEESGEAENSNNNNENENGQQQQQQQQQRLRTIPIKEMKLELSEKEQQMKQQDYVLFWNNQPLFPYVEQHGMIKLGHLKNIEYPIAYFQQSDNDEIYTVGLVLENDINKQLNTKIHNNNNNIELQQQYEVECNLKVKQKDQYIKITEIYIIDNKYFCKGIPYKNIKKSKKIQFQAEFNKIFQNCQKIKKILLQVENMEIFKDLYFQRLMDMEELNEEQGIVLLYRIIQEVTKLNEFFSDDMNIFCQSILECRSLQQRLSLLKDKLEDICNGLEVIQNTSRVAQQYKVKMDKVDKAKQSIEYIKNVHLSGSMNITGGGSSNYNFNSNNNQQNNNMNQAAKVFQQKLHLIKDEISRQKVKKEIDRFQQMDKMNQEYHKLNTYLDEVFSIPWDIYTEEKWDLKYTQNILNQSIHGLESVKNRIVEMIAVNNRKYSHKGTNTVSQGLIILLCGPPGTGKTSIAKAIGDALQRKTRLISFSGVTDPNFIKGHRRTYVDSQPGVFVKELIKAATSNPVFILDEIDKVSKSNLGADPYYSLMEILNPEENSNFVDHYLDIKVDFSKVVFILTANDIVQMLEPLKNRLEIIYIPPYIQSEKVEIAQKYLLPSVLQQFGFAPKSIQLSGQAIDYILQGWCLQESGVRELKRQFQKIARRYAVQLQKQQEQNKEQQQQQQQQQQEVVEENIEQNIEQNKQIEEETAIKKLSQRYPLIINEQGPQLYQRIKEYLDNPVYDQEYERRNIRAKKIGIVNILTVSGFSGDVLTVECCYDYSQPDKKGLVNSSGNIKQVLQESLNLARMIAFRYLKPDAIQDISQKNIHIHFTTAASPKDGPSAGISICVAFLSLFLQTPIPADLSITGEISLTGEIHKIGGLQAKLTASKIREITKVIVPYGNLGEFLELPEKLKEGMTVYFAKTFNDVYQLIFEGKYPDIDVFYQGKLTKGTEIENNLLEQCITSEADKKDNFQQNVDTLENEDNLLNTLCDKK